MPVACCAALVVHAGVGSSQSAHLRRNVRARQLDAASCVVLPLVARPRCRVRGGQRDDPTPRVNHARSMARVCVAILCCLMDFLHLVLGMLLIARHSAIATTSR
eukprot:6915501-Alexandrium_andersonii.AAC.1